MRGNEDNIYCADSGLLDFFHSDAVYGSHPDTNYGVSSVQEFFAIICSLFIASAPIYCGIALGMSVFLRRKGRSLAGFIVHFAGFVSLLLSFSFYNIRKSGSLTEI